MPAWLEAKHYAVNILREDQSEISTRFAHAGGRKWEGLKARRGVTPSVLLPDALAWLECESYAHRFRPAFHGFRSVKPGSYSESPILCLLAGLNYTAAVMAAIAFERALRETAPFFDMDPRRPLGPFVRELGRRAEMPEVVERLGTLVQLRNSLVHPDDNDVVYMDGAQAKQILQAFRNGVDYLEYVLAQIPAVAVSGFDQRLWKRHG